MNRWIACWNIVLKDMKAYYLKPPNVSWGLLFPLAWAGMFLIRSGQGVHSLVSVLPGMIALSVLFGTSSMLAVAVTFEKKAKAFERLVLAPIPLWMLMLAKTSGAVVFGMFNALVPILLGLVFSGLSGVAWSLVAPAILLMALASTYLSLLLAVLATEVFEVQTLSNFVRFPMIFLCGLFFPVTALPELLQPFSYLLPITYGVDLLHHAMGGEQLLSVGVDFALLAVFCLLLFAVSLRSINRHWIG
ncbi:MAG: ABC transporter permease [Chlorobium sp.]|jgi:ABC-2 type transport system permease protein|uniref:ABC transporter permease n=1 Tax=Chlorobium sp. TaxID=1095 RepID=UPI001D616906|nr:ABC transporter permease [Chlorobium sp.]MBN1278674.1 ABC transporter permease [Chlorobiaceae bacterium]MCF8216681.1 ABC transporter permease [Chlorobium sp.]MCF8270858.1 ABC transporter permease [Chlorobium sp.]MCF8287208.1 ABC transporter permease [Chlorobium sp.]MCF8290865.1 ABC transporter permease [Chlorobium sp.]